MICDNSPIDQYEVTENGITVWQKEETWTHFIKGMHIQFHDRQLAVYNRIKNNGAWPVEAAAWAISAVAAGGQAVCPVVRRDTGLLPNANFVMWPYTRLNDERLTWGEEYIRIKGDPLNKDEFKIGYLNEAGWFAYLRDNLCLIKRFDTTVGVNYPDRGYNCECFTTFWGLEMETLSPLATIQPGAMIEHRELWQLEKITKLERGDEAEIKAVLEPLMGLE